MLTARERRGRKETSKQFHSAVEAQLAEWATAAGWNLVKDPKVFAFSPGHYPDLVLESEKKFARIDVTVGSDGQGLIRIQAVPTFREAYVVGRDPWTVELGAVPLDRPWNQETFAWLLGRLFAT